MGESRTAWWLRVIAIVAVLAGTASAQRSRKPEAEVLFKQGKAAMTAGDLTTACTKFESSNALDARASTMMNLGACYEAQGKVVSAWYAFDEASRLAARKDDVVAMSLRLPYSAHSNATSQVPDASVEIRNASPRP